MKTKRIKIDNKITTASPYQVYNIFEPIISTRSMQDVDCRVKTYYRRKGKVGFLKEDYWNLSVRSVCALQMSGCE